MNLFDAFEKMDDTERNVLSAIILDIALQLKDEPAISKWTVPQIKIGLISLLSKGLLHLVWDNSGDTIRIEVDKEIARLLRSQDS